MKTTTKTKSSSPLKASTEHLSSPSGALSWREEKENAPPSLPKSHGISPTNFHRKRRGRKVSPTEEAWKETLEDNLLCQGKIEHKQQLEDKRKAFKQVTQLKTWPLQDMAMEHLDHLIHNNGKSGSQFHGGDYLSSESSSSVSSVEASKRHHSSSPGKKNAANTRLQKYLETFELEKDKPSAEVEPLWSQEPRIFATEKAQGKRKYLVGHFGRIADWYWRKANPKHLYEVIRENTPCRLYFDLEFSKMHNPGVDSAQLLEEFRLELQDELQSHFQITFELSQLIDLDSSTDAKFSRHWVLNLKDCLFHDAPTVGRFVKGLVARLAEELATGQLHSRCPALAKHLFVSTKEQGKTSCFIDLGVYTRNRLFRVFASSKFGKTAVLQASDTNQFPIELPPKQPPTPKSTLEEYIIANNWEPHARVLADTLVVPLGGSAQCRILQVDEEETKTKNSNTKTNDIVYHPAIPMARTKTTPLPSLDKYVLEVLATRGGVSGAIRAWSIEYGPRDALTSMTYQLSRNRFCEMIGRPHKSNNIFWTIVFGDDSWTCIQGCHDPECFGRGSPIAIPKERLQVLQAEFQAWQEEEFEKALLALNLEEEKISSTAKKKIATTSTTALSKETNENASLKSPAESQEQVIEDESLSDKALLDAVLSNPELFP